MLLWGVSTYHPNPGLPADPAALGIDRMVWMPGPDGGAMTPRGPEDGEGPGGREGDRADDLLRDLLAPAARQAIEVLGVSLLAVSLPSKDPTVTLVLGRGAARFHLQLHVPGSGRPHYRATARFLAGYGGDAVPAAQVDALIDALDRAGADPEAIRRAAGLSTGPRTV